LEDGGGNDAVIRWLQNRDLSAFDCKAPPKVTVAKRRIIDDGKHATFGPLGELIEAYLMVIKMAGGEEPVALFPADLTALIKCWNFDGDHPMDGFLERDEKAYFDALNGRSLHRKMENYAFYSYPNPDAAKWRIKGFQSRSAFAHRDLIPDVALQCITDELARRPLSMLHVLATARNKFKKMSDLGEVVVPFKKPF
jgi:hypothetical protein